MVSYGEQAFQSGPNSDIYVKSDLEKVLIFVWKSEFGIVSAAKSVNFIIIPYIFL